MTAVNGSLSLNSVDASTLTAAVAGYIVTLAEAGGVTPPAPIAVALDATSFSLTLGAGSWTASAVAVDATGVALTAPAISAPLVLTAPVVVMVSVPGSVSLTAA